MELVEFLKKPMSRTRTRSIPMLQIFFSCIRLHKYDPRDRKGAWRTRSEGSWRRTIRNMQKLISGSDSILLGAPVTGKASDPIIRATWQRTRTFLKDKVEGEDIVVILELLSKHSRKEQVLVPRDTVAKKEINSKPEKQENGKEEDNPESEENVYNNQTPYCLVGSRSMLRSRRNFCLSGR